MDISREAIADLASQATRRVGGVADLYLPPVEGIALRLRREFVRDGVKVEQEGDAWVLTLYIRVEYKAHLPAVAAELKKQVKDYVEGLAGVTVSEVEVSVEDVAMPS